MEHYDSQMAARVWQRVQGGNAAENPTADLLSSLQEELTELSRYRQIAGTLGSASKPGLQQLIHMTQQCISILRGIYSLLTDTAPEVKPFPLPKELPVSALRRSYGSTLRRSARYDQWSSHSEYGCAFSEMAALSQKRCCLLLQLIGTQNDHFAYKGSPFGRAVSEAD